MDALLILILVAAGAVPLIAITALVAAIRNANRTKELERELEGLKGEFIRLRSTVRETDSRAPSAGPQPEASNAGAEPGNTKAPEPQFEHGEGTAARADPAEAFLAARRSASPKQPTPSISEPEEDAGRPETYHEIPARAFSAGNAGDTESDTPFLDILRRANILPPAAEDRGEAGLGAWWTTRIGTVMAVIAAVFFGVYIAQDTPAWLRWLALFAVSCGVCGSGAWLEKRNAEIAGFGRVVFAGGLALIYFCAFAAYGIAPVRIVGSATAGGALQAIAVGIILAASLWKQRQGVAVMAIFLGYVSCIFAFAGDLTNFAMFGAALLAAGAAAILIWREWRQPLGVALAGAWAVMAIVVGDLWIPGAEEASFLFGMGIIAGAFAFFVLVDSVAARGGRGFLGNASQLYHYTNSAAALLLGWFFTWRLFPESLDVFYLVFAVLTLGASEEFRRRKEGFAPATGFFVKGSALAALFLVAFFAGEVRWLGILAQAACVLAVLRERREIALEVFFYGVIALAIGLFLYDVSLEGGREELNVILAGIFILALGSVLAVRRRFIAEDTKDDDPAIMLALLGQLGAGVSAIAYANVFFGPLNAVFCSLAAIASFGGMEFLAGSKHRWFAASALAFIYGQSVFILGWNGDVGTCATIASGIGLIAVGLGGATAVATVWQNGDKGAPAVEAILHAVWLLTLTLVLFRIVPDAWFLTATVLGVWMAVGAVLLLRVSRLAFLSGLPFFYGLVFVMWDWPPEFSPAALWIAVLLGIGYMLAMGGALKPLREQIDATGMNREGSDFGGGLLLFAVYVAAVRETVFPQWIPVLLGVGAMGIGAAWRWRSSLSWGTFALLLAVLAQRESHFRILDFHDRGEIPGMVYGEAFLLIGILPAIATLGLALIMLPYKGELSERQTGFAALAGGSALLLVYIAAMTPVFRITDYATAVWGVAAVVLFVLGVVFRIKPFRMAALVGLGLCVVRVFAYDVQDTFYRIIAFAVLGAVLLGIGYLYHRFRERLEEKPDPPE